MKKTALLALLAPALAGTLALLPINNQKKRFHSDAELAHFRAHFRPDARYHGPQTNLLPIDSNILFPTAKSCGGCHGFDPNGFALVTSSEQDVNIYDDWRSTMMANSSKDPFWRAKVTHEILVNPAHSLELQDKCTSCHAPAGHYQAKLKRNQPHYSLYEMYTDSLGLDGVTCQACHAQPADQLGTLHSGNLYFDTNYIRVAYGPYEFVFTPPMHNFVGITPKYGPHILDAGLCAGCHTLITNTVDLQGAPTGGTFVEQATYHEWLNSRYDEAHDNVSCQDCHLPQIEDAVIISANYLNLTPRSPFGLHEMAGANTTMLKLLRDNRAALQIDAKPEHFDSTIAATLRMLQHKTLDLDLQPGVVHGDTMRFSLKLQNKAGHKFPSGYPARRAWVEFELQDAAGNTLFHSGRMAADYSLPDEDAQVEPHYQIIHAPGQVQIYEMAAGDVNGEVTTVLERGAFPLKDNRLVPQGFSTVDPAYDTTRIVGAALADPDFNRLPDGGEGSGADILHFHIPNPGITGAVRARAKVWYQSLPPKWLAPMFEFSSPEIDSFRLMFNQADKSPVLIAEATLENVLVSPVSAGEPGVGQIAVSPTFCPDGRLTVHVPASDLLRRVQVWNARGQLVWDRPVSEVELPAANGLYFVVVETRRERKTVKIVR
ncbi:MAG: hypothetical protein RL742_121 [Bacteroidota bacterium]